MCSSFICYVVLVGGTVGMVFVTVEILAEDQIVLEQLRPVFAMLRLLSSQLFFAFITRGPNL